MDSEALPLTFVSIGVNFGFVKEDAGQSREFGWRLASRHYRKDFM